MTSTVVPESFSPLYWSSPFLETIGPLYSRGWGESLSIALCIAAKHTNARGFAHGEVLSTLADIALDYAGTAKLGDWIETNIDIQKIGSAVAWHLPTPTFTSDPTA